MKAAWQWKDYPSYLAESLKPHPKARTTINLEPKRFHAYSAAKPKETEMKDFDKDGLGFLIKFARQRRGKSFCAEDVTIAAKHVGILPPDLRQWGKLFQQAARDGYTYRCTTAFRRSMGNAK